MLGVEPVPSTPGMSQDLVPAEETVPAPLKEKYGVEVDLDLLVRLVLAIGIERVI